MCFIFIAVKYTTNFTFTSVYTIISTSGKKCKVMEIRHFYFVIWVHTLLILKLQGQTLHSDYCCYEQNMYKFLE
jgi:hypothetical protein